MPIKTLQDPDSDDKESEGLTSSPDTVGYFLEPSGAVKIMFALGLGNCGNFDFKNVNYSIRCIVLHFQITSLTH